MNTIDPSKVYRLLYPAVPAIISCYDQTGSTFGMPVVSIISLSGDPPLIGVASSPNHVTHEAILRAGCFSLSWVDVSLVRSVELLGTMPRRSGDKLEMAGLKHTKGNTLDVPIIEGAVASLECSLYAKETLGDHELLVGRVQEAQTSDDFQEYWKFEKYRPILYTGIQHDEFRTYKPSKSSDGGSSTV
jgi:flavin reductase (DIM6/NTAB) family NADH-FMN oxidoreductase RutF